MADHEEIPIPTKKFLDNLINAPDLKSFINNNADILKIPEFHIYITELCKSKSLVAEQVIRQSSIERTYGHQLFNGTRKPSREKVIQLAFGFGLSLEETQKMLIIAQRNGFYPKVKRDAVIIYCLINKKSLFETQSTLQELGLTLLGGDDKYG